MGVACRLDEGDRIWRNLCQRGFAVIRLGQQSSVRLRELVGAAKEFFEATPLPWKLAQKRTFVDSGGDGLVGYNQPHCAKQVLRLRRGATEAIPAFPATLRPAALAAFDIVEALALGSWRAVPRELAPSLEELGVIVGPSEKLSSSPFDLMYYDNKTDRHNSTPHIDSPGLLTVIPVSETPGLAIYDQQLQAWISVEHLYRPLEYCVVMAASSLQLLVHGAVTAATHEVRKHYEPRLSLVYELRPALHLATRLALVCPRPFSTNESTGDGSIDDAPDTRAGNRVLEEDNTAASSMHR